jgi:hypothetical protein
MIGHDDKIMDLEFLTATYERKTSMNNIALRSDCNSGRPILVFVVTKNVREVRTMSDGFAFRIGMAICRG